MSLIQNERTKLLATAANNLAVAILVTAVLAPSASMLYGLSDPTLHRGWLVVGAAWIFAGIALHVVAHLVLGRLKP